MPKSPTSFNIVLAGQRFNWSPTSIKLSEASAIERAYGKPFMRFGNDLAAGSMYAVQVLCWSLLRRSNPNLRIDDVDLAMDDVELEVVDDEQQAEGEAQRSTDAGFPTDAAPAAATSTSSDSTTSATSPTGSASDPGSGST